MSQKVKTLVTAKEFHTYENIRTSGATNMFDVGAVEALGGLTREKIFYIMKNYRELKEKFEK